MDEVLFLEEFEKADEVPVLVRALPVDEPDAARHVVRERQCGSASRALKRLRERWLRCGGVLADVLHQLQRGCGGEL